ncbi:glycosyltransferase [Evansella sp. AB-rgal1]|uniref:MGDG synthase family glycosyltransferase n=1 Tax=Evansella sp. AB-rgal1 TaxID=3242696 RepID=UPI00359D7D5F
MKRMAIFTVSIGEGHHQVSAALKEEWEERGYEAEIIDIFSLMCSKKAEKIRKSYFQSIRYPILWDTTYRLTNCKLAGLLVKPLIFLWWKKAVAKWTNKSYDIIVTTHPIATQLGVMLKKHVTRPIKLFAVLTDFSTHSLSFSKEVDAIFIARKNELGILKNKAPKNRFFSHGIPLKKIWDHSWERNALRKKLALSEEEQIIVVSGGGEGVISKEIIWSILEKDTKPSTVLWFLGKKQTEIPPRVKLDNGTEIRYFIFSDQYHEYVKVADFFISKPGGVSMAEALAWGIPTGILCPLPGQEKINQTVLAAYPTMIMLNKETNLSSIIKKLDKSPRNKTGELSRVKVIDEMINLVESDQVTQNQHIATKRWFTSFGRKREWSS